MDLPVLKVGDWNQSEIVYSYTDTKYPGMKTYLQEDKGKLAGNLAQERKKRKEVRAMILASEEETRKKKRRKREKWE